MLRTFTVALFAVAMSAAMSVGVAQAKHMKHMMATCADGAQVTKNCLCGTADAGGKPAMCKKGQWCHASSHMCGT